MTTQTADPSTPTTTAAPAPLSTEDFAERVFGSLLGAFDTVSIFVGEQLGLYDALHRRGPLTYDEAAEQTAIHRRYAREWLEQQTVAGLVEVVDAAAPAEDRRYRLPDAYAEVLCNRDSLSYMAPFARMLAAAAIQLPALLEAYRTGGGVAWETYGALMRTAQADANRPLFLQLLGHDWLSSLPDVDDAAARRRPGWPTSAAAKGGRRSASPRPIPGARRRVRRRRGLGAAARRHAAEHGVSDRVRFTLVDAGTLPAAGDYDLVTAFECVHDMPDPVSVLAGAAAAGHAGRHRPGDGRAGARDVHRPRGPGGAADVRLPPLICLPDGMSHDRLGRHRHGDAARHAARLRQRGRLRRRRGAADRARLLPVLPADPLTAML